MIKIEAVGYGNVKVTLSNFTFEDGNCFEVVSNEDMHELDRKLNGEIVQADIDLEEFTNKNRQ